MIILVLALGLSLRLISLNQSLWLDEAISAIAAKNYSFAGIITSFLPGDTHPPLYYLLLKTWASIFGFSEVSLRMPSVVFGVLTVFMVYLIGKRLGGKKLGLISSLLAATAPLHIYYSQEARMYALSTFFITSSLYCFIVLLEKSVLIKWLGFSVAILLVGMTDYLPLLVLPALWLWSLVFVKKKSFKFKFALVHVPLAGFYIFWLPTLLTQWRNSKTALANFSSWSGLLGGTNLKELALVWIKFITGRIPFDKSPAALVVFGTVSLVVIIALYKSAAKRKIRPVLVIIMVSFALVALCGVFSPGFSYFRLLFLLPFFYLLVAYGIVDLPHWKYLAVLLVSVNLMYDSFYLFRPSNFREDWRGLVGYIEGNVKDNEAVLMAFPDPFAGYVWYSKMPELAYGTRGFDIPQENYVSRVTRLVQNRSDVYTLDYLMDVTDPGRTEFKTLKSIGFKEIRATAFRGLGSVRYWVK